MFAAYGDLDAKVRFSEALTQASMAAEERKTAKLFILIVLLRVAIRSLSSELLVLG